MKVRVVPPDPTWKDQFEAEAERIRSVLSGAFVQIHHIGSTSIPGIYAKPIIDMLLEVDDVADLDRRTPALTPVGYEAKGEFGIPGRRYFRKDSEAGIRTHHIHAFASADEGLERHLAFRDYMIAHPAIAQSYSDLKRRLVSQFPDDSEAYMDGKDSFVKEHERNALTWKKQAQPSGRPNAEEPPRDFGRQ